MGLLDLLGNAEQTYPGLISPEQNRQAQYAALLTAGLGTLAASNPGRGQPRPNTAQVLLGGLGAGQEAYQGMVKDAIAGQKFRAEQEKLMQERANQASLRSAIEPLGQREVSVEDYNRAFSAALASGNDKMAEQIRKAMELKFPGVKPAEFTGAYGNLALAMFGTNDVGRLSPEQRAGLDAEARKRQLERPASTTINLNSGGENEFQKATGKAIAEQFGEASKAGLQAQRALGDISQLEGLLAQTGGGIGPAARTYLANAGIDVKGANELQAVQALVNKLVPQQRPAGSGTMSDRDVELFKASLPRIINQPGGNEIILRSMRGIAEYDAQMGQIANAARTGKISKEQALQAMENLPNPLANFAKPASKNDDVQRLLKQYGGK